MNSKERVLQRERERGRADALDLATRAADMTGTEIIVEESKVPQWREDADYSACVIGSPVSYNGQVYTLLQPHNAANYPDTNPETLPALWSITHTKDPKRAKPYLTPNGTSGMYMIDECCTESEHVYQSKIDNNVWEPSGYPDGWDDLGTIEKVQI